MRIFEQKLEMRNISKSFPGVEALNDVSITACSGKIMGLVGVNGAGKSTLMNILGGIYTNDSGKIILNGNPILLKTPNDAAKNGISVLNTPGTIDSDYRGEIKIILINLGKKSFIVKSGDRIAQMVLCPIVKGKLKEVKNLPKTVRGKKGFGSTGK